MKTLAALTSVLALFTLIPAIAAGPEKITDLAEALSKAQSQNKTLFVQYGREACGNCQELKGYIKSRRLKLPEAKFVYADVNCDDPATSRLFNEKFKVRGSTLPFVVVVAPDGTQLAARTGYGTIKQYDDLLRDAAKASKTKE